MATLRDYFLNDLNFCLSVQGTCKIRQGDAEGELTGRLHLDHRSNGCFYSYFIPEMPDPADVCRRLVLEPNILSLGEGVGVEMANQYSYGVQSRNDLAFTRQLLFYIDTLLNPADAGGICQFGRQAGFVVKVFDRKYAQAQEEARLKVIADKLQAEPGLVAVRQQIADFRALLDGATREEEAHQFLKSHPALLGLTSTIEPLSKFRLGSDYVTDFVINDVPYGYVLVEIEKATSRLFKKGSPPERHGDLNHAIEQVESWRTWTSRNHAYVLPKLPGVSPTPLCWVILGRTARLTPEERARLTEINDQQRGVYTILTYDDLLQRLETILDRLTSCTPSAGPA